jgi:hypothetical protein
MVSHRSLGGLEISIGGGGLRFKKRPSGFNICVGNALKGKKYAKGGRYSTEVHQAFTAAVRGCK